MQFNLTKRKEKNVNESEIIVDNLLYTGNIGSFNVNDEDTYYRDVNKSYSSVHSTDNSTVCLDYSSDYKNQHILEYDDTESRPSSICSSSLSETSGLSEEIPINNINNKCHLKYLKCYRPRIPLYKFISVTLNDCNNTISESDNVSLVKSEKNNTFMSFDICSLKMEEVYLANSFIKHESEESSECNDTLEDFDEDCLIENKTEINPDLELKIDNIKHDNSTEKITCTDNSESLQLEKQNQTSSELNQLRNEENGKNINKIKKCIASSNDITKATLGEFKKDILAKTIPRITGISVKKLTDTNNFNDNYTILKLRNRTIKCRNTKMKESKTHAKKTLNNKQKYSDKNKILDCNEKINNCLPKAKNEENVVKIKKLKRKAKTKEDKTRLKEKKSLINNTQKVKKSKTPVIKIKLKSNLQKIKQDKTYRKKPRNLKENVKKINNTTQVKKIRKLKNNIPRTIKNNTHLKKSENFENNLLVTNKIKTNIKTENFKSNLLKTKKTKTSVKRIVPINASETYEDRKYSVNIQYNENNKTKNILNEYDNTINKTMNNKAEENNTQKEYITSHDNLTVTSTPEQDDKFDANFLALLNDDAWEIFPKTSQESSIQKKRSFQSNISDYPSKLIKVDVNKVTQISGDTSDKLVSFEIKRKQESHDVEMKADKGINYLKSETIKSKNSKKTKSILHHKEICLSSDDIYDTSDNICEDIAVCCLENYSIYFPNELDMTDPSSDSKKYHSIYY